MGDVHIASPVFQLDAEVLRTPDVGVDDYSQVERVPETKCQQEAAPSDRRNRDIDWAGTP